jgi:(p)ppGpp synthase/HD superfamily hydrolase
MSLSRKYLDALAFASRLHRTQVRKGTRTPYVTHLMAVSTLVMEYGGDEQQAIAGLLHDAIEDQAEGFGGADKLRLEIRRRFGGEVLRIIEACSDTDVVPKPPWGARKKTYLAHLAKVDRRVALVSCCDKIHNARSIVADHRRIGDKIFERFSASKRDTLWYYGALSRTYQRHHATPAADEFAATVRVLRKLARG